MLVGDVKFGRGAFMKDKAKAVEIMAQFGVKGVRDVPDDKLAEVFAAIQVATAALGG